MSGEAFIVVTAYTPEYQQHYDRLRLSLRKYGIRHAAYQFGTRGSWERNCSQKPRFMLNAMEENRNVPIVWLDADAEVVRYPSELATVALTPGLAVSYRVNEKPDHPFNRAMSGTVLMRQTYIGKAFIRQWADICARNPAQWDQVSLAQTHDSFETMPAFAAAFRPLPVACCTVFDDPVNRESACIIHHQASRQLKDVMKSETAT